jgi:predicted nucleic acid-binding protein
LANVLLDTTVLIDLLRGRRGAVSRLGALRAQGDRPYACAVNVDEVVRGLLPPEERSARVLFGGLRVVRLGELEGWRAGEWRRVFASKGRTLAQADCLVAAAAATIGGRLATGNPKDFPMSGIAVEHWPSGE